MDYEKNLKNIRDGIFIVNNFEIEDIEEDFNNLKSSAYDVLSKLEIDSDLEIVYLKMNDDQLLVFKVNDDLAYMKYQNKDLSMFSDKGMLKFANLVASFVAIYFEEINKKIDPNNQHIRKKVIINKNDKIKKYKR